MALTDLNTFEGIRDVSKVTDEQVKQWVNNRCEFAGYDIPSRVKDVLSKVRFHVDNKDPEGSAITFFVDFITSLRRSTVMKILNPFPKIFI